ncbi:zinc-binding dehydrogenase [Catellatospora coxensis]
MPANFSGARIDGTRGVHRIGPDARPVSGHFFGQSSFATHALATRRNTVKVDRALPLELLGPLGCGFQTGAGAVLNTFSVSAGDTIAIFGVGAVGFGALMAAHLAGAATIIAVDVNPQRLALAADLGATHTVNALEHEVAKTIQEITGAGVGYVLDTTGRADMLDNAVDALRPLGRVGLVAGGAPDSVVPAAKLAFGKTVSGIVQGDAVPQLFIPRLVELFASGRFPVDRLIRFYDFDDIEAAFAAAASGEAVKPVLRMPPAEERAARP